MAPETIADALLARLDDHRPGLRTRESVWTWDEVVRESARRAQLAQRWRDDRPFHIGVLLDNVPEFVFWLGGAALAGATVVGINPTRRGEELEREVRHTDCQLLVTDSAGVQLLDGLDIGVDRDRFFVIDHPEYADSPQQRGDCVPDRDEAVRPGTQMLLLLTSGTTGRSKAARCSQGRLLAIARAASEKYEISSEDVCYCPMPLFHGNALMALWSPALVVGACVALTPKFTASRFLDDVRAFGATFFTYVGKAIGYVLATDERADDAENTLTHAFGTEASPADRREFLRRFGCRLVEGYGSSEGGGHVQRAADAPEEALGRPAHEGIAVVDPESLRTCPLAEVDGTGRIGNAGEAVGEIVDKEGAAAFEGYYNDPEADAERVRNGWYWTGDLGFLDPDGFLHFAGRAGDWMRVDGENVSALSVERILLRHPDIVVAGVFGAADPKSGDRVMAAVELAGGVEFASLDLEGFLAEQPDLSTKSAPRFVRVSAQLPTTGSNKLRKNQMRLVGWRTDDPVHYRDDPRARQYRPMGERDKEALAVEFRENGRQQFLPSRPGSAEEPGTSTRAGTDHGGGRR